ncbi:MULTISPECIES: hypothetical protein [unclassified Archaeoglobus]|jgi:hypothetical protein|uniref:hypothetical protein n=1 Tax=unclassified Archaeoglobus TaxID=2643606 RepID=UPI0025C068FB|nr:MULTISPECIES: hypothetical protein [unclassified Archaeoglobus]
MSDELEFESKDITDDIILKVTTDEEKEDAEAEEAGEEKPEKIPEEDHPAIALLDLAVKQSVEFCKSQGLPEPNMAIYENFSRPFLNKAFWHYLPEGDLPDDPKLALLLGIAGLGFAYIPTIMAFWKKQKEEAEVKAEKQDRKPKPKPVQEKEELREKAREAEKEKQEQMKQNEELPPIAKRLQYESFAGI